MNLSTFLYVVDSERNSRRSRPGLLRGPFRCPSKRKPVSNPVARPNHHAGQARDLVGVTCREGLGDAVDGRVQNSGRPIGPDERERTKFSPPFR